MRARARSNVQRCLPSRARPCGPRQDGDGSCQLGARVWGSQGGVCGFEGDFGMAAPGYSTDSVVRSTLLKKGDL